MKFYLCEVVTYKDDTADSKSMYEYDTADKATANAKKDMGSWMLNDNCASIGVIALTETFGTLYQDYWAAPIEPEPEPEPEGE